MVNFQSSDTSGSSVVADFMTRAKQLSINLFYIPDHSPQVVVFPSSCASGFSHAATQFPISGQVLKCSCYALSIGDIHQIASHTVQNQFVTAQDICCHHRLTHGHGLACNVPKGFVARGKSENVEGIQKRPQVWAVAQERH